MTRETKAGLVVSCSFLCLVGAVVVVKLRQQPAELALVDPAKDAGDAKARAPQTPPTGAPQAPPANIPSGAGASHHEKGPSGEPPLPGAGPQVPLPPVAPPVDDKHATEPAGQGEAKPLMAPEPPLPGPPGSLAPPPGAPALPASTAAPAIEPPALPASGPPGSAAPLPLPAPEINADLKEEKETHRPGSREAKEERANVKPPSAPIGGNPLPPSVGGSPELPPPVAAPLPIGEKPPSGPHVARPDSPPEERKDLAVPLTPGPAAPLPPAGIGGKSGEPTPSVGGTAPAPGPGGDPLPPIGSDEKQARPGTAPPPIGPNRPDPKHSDYIPNAPPLAPGVEPVRPSAGNNGPRANLEPIQPIADGTSPVSGVGPAGPALAQGASLPPAPPTPNSRRETLPPAVGNTPLAGGAAPPPGTPIPNSAPEALPPAVGNAPLPIPAPIPAPQPAVAAPAPLTPPVVERTTPIRLPESLPAQTLAPSPAQATTRVVTYEETVRPVAAGDSFEALSKQYYNNEGYAKALQKWNQDHPRASQTMREQGQLVPGDRIFIPEAAQLEQHYGTLITNRKPPAPSGTLQTGFTDAAQLLPRYQAVRAESIEEIARQTAAPGGVKEILRLNPALRAGQTIPAGMPLLMPTGTQIPTENLPPR